MGYEFKGTIKVCGMKYAENIMELSRLPVDYMGFIFYAKSPRYCENELTNLDFIPKNSKKIGVFVNETHEKILATVQKYNLDGIQLHGAETPVFCKTLKQKLPHINITKAINIENITDIEKTKMYDNDCCDAFLFDTKTHLHGGSGLKFEWWTLDWYDGEIPFYLSGGISINDTVKIKEIQHPLLQGIDINSKFEIEPGLKNVALIKEFIEQLNK